MIQKFMLWLVFDGLTVVIIVFYSSICYVMTTWNSLLHSFIVYFFAAFLSEARNNSMAVKDTALHYTHTLYILPYCSTYLGRYKKMSTTIGTLVGTIVLVLLIGSLVLTPMAVYGVTVGSIPPVIPVPPLPLPAPYLIKYVPPSPYQITIP
jgi:hypothetical protein